MGISDYSTACYLRKTTSTHEVQNRESEICFLNASIYLFLTELVTSETPASNCEEQNSSASDQLPSQGEIWFLNLGISAYRTAYCYT